VLAVGVTVLILAVLYGLVLGLEKLLVVKDARVS